MTKFEAVKEDFQKAVLRLEEILQEKKTAIVRDSAIKRFELAFDLAWKTLKAYLEENHNAYCVSPQSCFREAYRVGMIEYDEGWLDIAKLRNRTVHTYNEILADDIYKQLPEVLTHLKTLLDSFV